MALHAIAGCVAAEAQGADCAAGAAGGAVQAIYAGVLNKGTNLTGQQQQQRAKLYGAFVGYLFSGGKGENVSAAANIAISGIANNRLLHRNESVRLLEELGLLKNSEAAGLVADLSDADLDKLLYSPKFFKLLTSRQHRIVAASCVLVHCNLQFADGDPTNGYNDFRTSLAFIGVNYTGELAQLRGTGLYHYSTTDLLSDYDRAHGGNLKSQTFRATLIDAAFGTLKGVADSIGVSIDVLKAVYDLRAAKTPAEITAAKAAAAKLGARGNKALVAWQNNLDAYTARVDAANAIITRLNNGENIAPETAFAALELVQQAKDSSLLITLALAAPVLKIRIGNTLKGLPHSRINLPQSEIDRISGIPKGSRPPPSSYLSKAQIDAHLARFDEGAVRFTSRTDVDKYGTAGNSEAFVMPKSEFDRIVSEAGGDLRVVEQRLGLDDGYLSSGDIMAVRISRQDMPDLRIPSGNESGARNQWVPGGFTSGRVPEAVVDLSNAPFTEIPF